jgi:hypothetical protein
MNPIKVPFAVKTSDPVLRDWIGEVREAIRNLSMRLPQGLRGFGLGGGGSSRCIAWKPTFREDSGTHYVKFRLGLLNQIAAENWNDEFEIAADATKWPVLNVTASNGQITGCEITLETSPPDQDQIAEDFPPDEFKIVLGVIDSLVATMAACENFEASAIEVFRQSRTPPAAGAEPFTRWWRWKVNQNTAGEYPFIT